MIASQTFLVCDDRFEKYRSGITWNVPQLEYVWCFPHETGVMCVGEEDHGGKVPFSSHHIPRIHLVTLSCHCVDLDLLAEAIYQVSPQ